MPLVELQEIFVTVRANKSVINNTRHGNSTPINGTMCSFERVSQKCIIYNFSQKRRSIMLNNSLDLCPNILVVEFSCLRNELFVCTFQLQCEILFQRSVQSDTLRSRRCVSSLYIYSLPWLLSIPNSRILFVLYFCFFFVILLLFRCPFNYFVCAMMIITTSVFHLDT